MLVSLLRITTVMLVSFTLMARGAGTEEYIIYPVYSLDRTASRELINLLNRLAGGEENVYASTMTYEGIPRYWVAKLTEEAFEYIKANAVPSPVQEIHLNLPIVGPAGAMMNLLNSTKTLPIDANLIPNETLSADVTYATQPTPAVELRVISQPKGYVPFQDITHYSNYVYPRGAGSMSYIYHAELGINLAHEDFRGRNIEWLYTPRAKYLRQDKPGEAFSKYYGHSTCTASKAVGNIYGAAKSATLVVVKMPSYKESDVGEILYTILPDIRRKSRRGYSVVSISWASEMVDRQYFRSPRWFVQMRADLHELVEAEVVVVCAAGNDARKYSHGIIRNNVDTAPAIFASQEKENMIVVGNSDNFGKRHITSQLTDPSYGTQIFAPGVDISCADARSASTGRRINTGTSFSAPLVAGVVAGFLPVTIDKPEPYPDDTVTAIRKKLVSQASWQRPDGGQTVIWNMVPETHNHPHPLTDTNITIYPGRIPNDTLTVWN